MIASHEHGGQMIHFVVAGIESDLGVHQVEQGVSQGRAGRLDPAEVVFVEGQEEHEELRELRHDVPRVLKAM